MNQNLQDRINKMCRQDKAMAILFVIGVWLAVLFVFFTIASIISNTTVIAVLGAAALVLLGLNTSSIVAMVSHYECDKHIIYELDIRHLDEQRALRKQGSR